MSDWVFLSKNKQDEYVNMFATGSGGTITDTESFVYEQSNAPIVLRGILKHKIMHRCWQDKRTFYYIDTGYFGNQVSAGNPNGWKLWHRIVPDDLQHNEIIARPDNRLKALKLNFHPRRYGKRIIVAVPDEKPCKFYGIDQQQWVSETVAKIKSYTDRPVIVRQRAPKRIDRIHTDPLSVVLADDVHALVTFNSAAGIESIAAGVPTFVLAPSHAAKPVANTDLSQIENPYWPDSDKLHAWACHLSYGQFHVKELKNGTAYKVLNEN